MKSKKWIFAVALGFLLATSSSALGQGKGHGKGHNKHGGDDDQGEQYYRGHDRDIRGWYDGHQSNLPPGLAKKDRLPPGLEKQLVRRGFKNDSNPVLRIWNGSYLRRLLIARTY